MESEKMESDTKSFCEIKEKILNEILRLTESGEPEARIDNILKDIEIWESQIEPDSEEFIQTVIAKSQMLYYKFKNFEFTRDKTAAEKLIQQILDLVTQFKDDESCIYLYLVASIQLTHCLIVKDKYQEGFEIIRQADITYKKFFDDQRENKESLSKLVINPTFISRDKEWIYVNIAHFLVLAYYGQSHLNPEAEEHTFQEHLKYMDKYVVPALKFSMTQLFWLSKSKTHKALTDELQSTSLPLELSFLFELGRYKQLEHVLACLMYELVKLRRSLPEASRSLLNPLQGLVSFYFMAATARVLTHSGALMIENASDTHFDMTSLEIIHDYDNMPALELYKDQFPLILPTDPEAHIECLEKYLKKALAWKKRGLELMKPGDWFYTFVQEEIARLDKLEALYIHARNDGLMDEWMVVL